MVLFFSFAAAHQGAFLGQLETLRRGLNLSDYAGGQAGKGSNLPVYGKHKKNTAEPVRSLTFWFDS